MRTTFVKTTAAGLAILAGAVGAVALPATALAQGAGQEQSAQPGQHKAGGEAMRRAARFVVTTSADAIGISPRELLTALRDQKSIAQVARDNGVDPSVVIDRLTADATAKIDAAVQAGRISPEKGEELKQKLNGKVTSTVNKVWTGHRGSK